MFPMSSFGVPYDHFHVFIILLQHIFERSARKINREFHSVSLRSPVDKMWYNKGRKKCVTNLLCQMEKTGMEFVNRQRISFINQSNDKKKKEQKVKIIISLIENVYSLKLVSSKGNPFCFLLLP